MQHTQHIQRTVEKENANKESISIPASSPILHSTVYFRILAAQYYAVPIIFLN